MNEHAEQSKAWERLTNFLSDTEGRSKEEVHRDLANDGVDVPAFLGRVQETVRKGMQAEWRRQARAEMAADDDRLVRVRHKVGLLTGENLRKVMASAAEGRLGNGGKALALAARNATGGDPSEEELRAYVEDILLASNGDPGEANE